MDEPFKYYRRAGRVVNRVLAKAMDIVEPGMPVIEVCERLEEEIARLGAKPAFPVNVSINWVAAHYSSPIGDTSTIPPKSLVKVDVGAHVDGYIADAAITLCFDDGLEPLAKAALKALKAAVARMRSGTPLAIVGREVHKTITSMGFRPIENLTGHKIDRYNLHAGKSVPNVPAMTISRAVEGEVYAVEPFATTGAGWVDEAREAYIYRITSTRRLKDRALREALEQLWREYRSLPFSERWLVPTFGENAREVLNQLIRHRRVYAYPVLVERKKGFVAQFEDTIIVGKNGAEVLTGVSTELFG